MSEILQGTTPTLRININTSDFLVTDVVKLEFYISNNNKKIIHGLSDMDVDSESNSISYTFSEEETIKMNPRYPLKYQLRFMFADGSIVGTKKGELTISDLESTEVMSE